MAKKIIGKEYAVEALASLCRDYRGAALRAVRQGGEEVFIPATLENSELMLEGLANPRGMFQATSTHNHSHGEPCYASLNEFLDGRNADGTTHPGYLLVDVVAKFVTDFCDRNGRSVVPEVMPLRMDTLISDLSGEPETFCLK